MVIGRPSKDHSRSLKDFLQIALRFAATSLPLELRVGKVHDLT